LHGHDDGAGTVSITTNFIFNKCFYNNRLSQSKTEIPQLSKEDEIYPYHEMRKTRSEGFGVRTQESLEEEELGDEFPEFPPPPVNSSPTSPRPKSRSDEGPVGDVVNFDIIC
jgi:hypothetical protein